MSRWSRSSMLTRFALGALLACTLLPVVAAHGYEFRSSTGSAWHSGASAGSAWHSGAVRAQRSSSSFGAILGMNKKSIHPGEGVRVRIENRGTEDVASTPRYALARRKHGAWVKVPTGPFFSPRYVVRAGTTGPWQSVRLPRQAEPGVYRVRKWIEAVEARDTKKPIQATFRVSTGSS